MKQGSGILLMSTLGVGDVLLAQPLAAALRGNRSDRFVILARAGSPAQLARRFGIADCVVDYVARWPHRLSGGVSLGSWIRRQRFEMVITSTGMNPYYSGLMALASGAPTRIGERCGRMPWAWTHLVEVMPGTHVVNRNRALGREAGVEAGLVPRLEPDGTEIQRARDVLGGHDRIIGIAPGSNRRIAHKRWSLVKYAQLVLSLRDEGTHVVVLGGPDEAMIGQDLIRLAGSAGLTNLVGATDVGLAAAVLSLCTLTVGNDGMLLHLSAAVGTPVVALFGPSDPSLFAPMGTTVVIVRKELPCAPCDVLRPNGCPERLCLESISVEDVMTAIGQVQTTDSSH